MWKKVLVRRSIIFVCVKKVNFVWKIVFLCDFEAVVFCVKKYLSLFYHSEKLCTNYKSASIIFQIEKSFLMKFYFGEQQHLGQVDAALDGQSGICLAHVSAVFSHNFRRRSVAERCYPSLFRLPITCCCCCLPAASCSIGWYWGGQWGTEWSLCRQCPSSSWSRWRSCGANWQKHSFDWNLN